MRDKTEEKKPETGRASVFFRTIAHFYDPDDPSPEDHRELSDRAEKQIFRQVLDVPKVGRKKFPDNLEIQIPASDIPPGGPGAIIAAVRAHFLNRAVEVERDTKLTVKVGLREFRLTIAVCLPSFAGIAICSQFKGDPVAEVVDQVLIIFCWVTIWQPFQSLVFDRWTLSRRAVVYRKIAEMKMSVKPASTGGQECRRFLSAIQRDKIIFSSGCIRLNGWSVPDKPGDSRSSKQCYLPAAPIPFQQPGE